MARAKTNTIKAKPAAQTKRVPKMLKLVGGGERPETAADRELDERRAKAAADMDAKGAFDIASGMEEDLRVVERLAAALLLMASSDLCEDDVSDALFAIAIGLRDPIKTAQEKQGQLSHMLWGYKFAEQPEAPAATATVAELDETIASLKTARARAKQNARAV